MIWGDIRKFYCYPVKIYLSPGNLKFKITLILLKIGGPYTEVDIILPILLIKRPSDTFYFLE